MTPCNDFCKSAITVNCMQPSESLTSKCLRGQVTSSYHSWIICWRQQWMTVTYSIFIKNKTKRAVYKFYICWIRIGTGICSHFQSKMPKLLDVTTYLRVVQLFDIWSTTCLEPSIEQSSTFLESPLEQSDWFEVLCRWQFGLGRSNLQHQQP